MRNNIGFCAQEVYCMYDLRPNLVIGFQKGFSQTKVFDSTRDHSAA